MSGCGKLDTSKSAYIAYEGVTITIKDVARAPSNLDENQFVIRYEVSGQPSDNFYGGQSVELIQLSDDNGDNCQYISPISGSQGNVLTKGSVEIVGFTNCENPNTEKIQFIFRESTTEGLNTVGEKFFMTVSDTPSEETMAVINDYIDKQKEQADEQAKAQAEKEAKINETQQLYDTKLKECINSQEAMQACLNGETNTALTMKRATDAMNGVPAQQVDQQADCKAYFIGDYCAKKVRTDVCTNNEYCSYIRFN